MTPPLRPAIEVALSGVASRVNRIVTTVPGGYDMAILVAVERAHLSLVVSGSELQSGSLSPLPVIHIAGVAADVQFAGLRSPGLFQFNVTIPAGVTGGDQPITAAYQGQSTQANTLITIHD